MKQQRYLVRLLLLGCLLYSCESSNEESPETGIPLRFSCEVQTRGAQTTTETLVSMGVVAYHTDGSFADAAVQQAPNFMNNQQMVKEANAWTYTPVKYWPQGARKKISFFAYAPFGTQANGLTVDRTTLTYDTPADVSLQPDLLVASPLKDQTQAEATDGITFRFQHLLACVSFTFKGGDTPVTSVRLNGVYTQGSLSLLADAPEWTLGAGKKEITYDHSSASLQQYLMLLPQALAGAEVTLTVGGKDKTFPLTGITAWEKSKRYNYVFDLTTF